jgi:UDP-3-O-[3-hydroxymyristoyl] N-acetylglucosamine deacetylase
MPVMLPETPLSKPPFQVKVTPHSASLSGIGLISGQCVSARLQRGTPRQGACFIFPNGERLPVQASHVANSARGITLVSPQGQTLSIVEHYLAALSFSGLEDIECHIGEGATELPLLDGSSIPWFQALTQAFGHQGTGYTHRVEAPFFFTMPGYSAMIYALPSHRLELSYTLNYTHKALNNTWANWQMPAAYDEKIRCIEHLLQARTFGEVKELPALQASGLAKGVCLENTLGLLEDNSGYTTPLRYPGEPHHHKMLDFVGDAYLSGLKLSQIQGKFCLLCAGHTSHLAFCQALMNTPGILLPL